MANLYAPADDELYLASGTGATLAVYRKKAKDVAVGEYVWSFVVESYAPEVRGHFQFIKVAGAATIDERDANVCRWFNQGDGPQFVMPKDWVLVEETNFVPADSRKSFRGFAHPGYLYDSIPFALDLEFFSNGFASPLLTEPAAYFMGAFAVRPQMQPNAAGTWGIFGSGFNQAGRYGTSDTKRHPALRTWMTAHAQSLRVLANVAWGAGNFEFEQKGRAIGLADVSVPPPLRGDRYLGSSGGPTIRTVGFAIHAPIARGIALDSTGHASDRDLRLAQYWYACIRSNLLERTTNSVKKAFLLGALDTVSNADENRKSIGLDFNEGFVGEFPMYSALHEIGQTVLGTFEGDETGNPRAAVGRTRGRIPRCRIYDAAEHVGFLSEMRFVRAKDYEPDIASIRSPQFPTPNVLSVLLGVPVHTVAHASGHGSSEHDLTVHKLFRSTISAKLRVARIPVGTENAFAACSLPLGTLALNIPRPSAPSGASHLGLSSSDWKLDALDKIYNINAYLPAAGALVPADLIFEFLIALLASKLDGCSDSWVVPRSEDQGVDVGASFDLGIGLGSLTAIFQAKLQASKVSRRIVDMLRGALFREGAQIGYVVTNSDFTVPAVRSAGADHPEIRLINGSRLVELLLDKRVGLFTRGSGHRRKVYVDLTFFEKIRALSARPAAVGGKVRIWIDGNGDPAPRL